MRTFLLCLCLANPLGLMAADTSYISEFYQSRNVEKSDLSAATELMIHSYHLAVTAGNADYTTAAGSSATQLIYRQGKVVEAGRFARQVILALDAFDVPDADGDAVRRTTIFGYLERGLLMEGQIGEAMRANRAAAETLRGRKVSADADAQPISLAEVIPLRPELRSLGWRLIERESELLDYAGRTPDSRALLDAATAYLEKNWTHLEPNERFYAFKLLASRALLLDFLGYQREAIQAEKDLLVLFKSVPNAESTGLSLRLNLLRNVSQWQGPSEEIMVEAREVSAALKRCGSAAGADRLLAKMELDLKYSKDALDVLNSDAKSNADLGHWLDAVYANRDSLIARSKLGENELDAEYVKLLETMRAQGNKRGEPSLYREYSSYLQERGRPAEAITLLVEALRLTRSFGWTLHEAGLLSALFEARFAAGDLTGARATLAELEAFLHAHPELPDSRRVPAEVSRAMALVKLGQTDAAKAALKLARELAKNLPEYQKRWLTAEAEAVILKGNPAATVAPLIPPPMLHVQPLEVTSVASPAATSSTRFSVFNPTAATVKGQWKITGPGAVERSDGVKFDASQPVVTISLVRSIPVGGQTLLSASFLTKQQGSAGQVRIEWLNAGQMQGSAAAWNVDWNASAKNRVVLDASGLEANPFRSVSLFHELAVPVGEVAGIPFRLRSPKPLRLEYYDASSQELLGIDANGNGDFTEAGDYHAISLSGIAAAILPVSAISKTLTVEVRLFAPEGSPLLPTASVLLLEAEVYRQGVWAKEAEDTLK
jgi:tetratricopeptide (TPR) repeat protein